MRTGDIWENRTMITTHRGTRTTALRHFGAGVCFALSLTAAMAAPPATVEGTYGTVAIGDFPGMIDRVGGLASKVNPAFTGDALKNQLGMLLGDPGLKNLAPGSGLEIVMPTTGKPFALIETAEGKAEAVGQTLTQRGMQNAVISPKLIAVAPDAAALEAAKGDMGKKAAEILAGNDEKALVITVDADKLIQDKGADLDNLLKSLPQKMAEKGGDTSAPAHMIQFVGGVIKAVAKRTDVATIKIDFSADGIQFEKTLYPIGGVNAPAPEGPTGADLLKMVPVSGQPLAIYDGTMDMQTAMQTMSNITIEALGSTDLPEADKQSLKSLLDLAKDGAGDAIAGWVNMDKEGSNGIYVVSIADKAKVDQYIDEGIKQANGGSLGKMYKALGLETSATLTRSAGTVDGQPYDQFQMDMKMPAAESDSPLQNRKVSGKFTYVDNKMVIALGTANLEEAVKAVKAGSAANAKTITASTALPAGGAFYADYDAGALATFVGGENEQAGKMLDSLKGTPMLEAGYINPDNLKFIIRIPAELITKAVNSAQSMSKSEDDSNKSTDTETKAPTE